MDNPTPLGTRTFASVRGAWIAPVLALTLSACALQKPANVSNEAQLTPPTPSATALLQLPPPQKKIVAAVYGFRDETGQYKPSPSSAFSTAVTQEIGRASCRERG